MKRMMKSFTYAISFLFTIFLIGCSPVDSLKPFDRVQASRVLQQHYNPLPTQQIVVFNLPQKRQWKKVDLSNTGNGSPVILIPTNESEASWTQSIRTYILGYQNIPTATPLSLVQTRIQHAKSNCIVKDVTLDTHNDQYAFYQMQLCACHDEKDQIQFGKALRGRDAIYMIYYSAVTDKVSSMEIDKMRQAIKSAVLVERR